MTAMLNELFTITATHKVSNATRRMRSRVAPDGPTDFTQIKIILTPINFNALASQFRETLFLRVISSAEYGAVEPLHDQRPIR